MTIKKKIKTFLRPLKKIINLVHFFLEDNKHSRVINDGPDRKLYQTFYNDFFWLKKGLYIDDCIINSGIFEDASTKIVKKFIRPGDTIINIGANIGYYSVIFGKLTGPEGRVFSFEPTKYFREVLKDNLAANSLHNVEIIPFGLSDKPEQLTIQIDGITATLHVPGGKELVSQESISLMTLEAFCKEKDLNKIDFIKIDVDGHEPAVLNGGWKPIECFRPMLLIEISHAHYLQSGTNAWDFYKALKYKGLYIYDENTLEEYKDLNSFLFRCGNFNQSANVLLSFNGIT